MTAEAKILPQPNAKYRLITRSDMDGLVCGIILKELDLIDDVLFAHPKDMQDGKIEVSTRDISTNLPYTPGVYLCFDHHASESARVTNKPSNHVIDIAAPSAARVLYNYFGGATNPQLSRIDGEMLTAVDKADSAAFTREDILDPQGWELLSFLMDSRTGLGRFREFRISNFQLMMNLIDYCREAHSIEEILEIPDVKERVELYHAQAMKARQQIEKCAKVSKNLVILDLRNEEPIWAANRFIIYALFPHCNISIHVLWGKGEVNTVFATGKSILNRTSRTHVGNLMLQYDGGGHEAAGTCQIDNDKAEMVLQELIDQINKDG